MAKTATETKTKTATKDANTRTRKPKADKEDKPKRAPTPYNNFVSTHLKQWRADNPDKTVKDGMVAVAAMWRDAPENPKRGQAPAKKAVKGEKENKTTKAKPATRAKKAAPPPSDDDEGDDDEGSE